MMMDKTTWERLPAIEGTYGGCLNCGPRPRLFPADGKIAVGFGYAALHRDGKPVYTAPNDPGSDSHYMTGKEAEELAATDPDQDWRIVLVSPMSERTYQRHGANEWALVEQGIGFA
jgi:hypothetical protein